MADEIKTKIIHDFVEDIASRLNEAVIVARATIADLMAATGWLPHTTRAALTGLRKGGLSIIRERDSQADASVYRIEPSTVSAVA